MRKVLSFLFFSVLLVCVSLSANALERQPGADYHARREALAKKAGGIVLLFAPLEAGDAVYGFRQEDNFYYLSGLTEPGWHCSSLRLSRPKQMLLRRPMQNFFFFLLTICGLKNSPGRSWARKIPMLRRSRASTMWKRWGSCQMRFRR